ncbi:MAG: hypothetical protein A3F14_00375 [Gammaproteobacteria bacterium RIFCSPHIGHO2_12_FULL_43_28]|nr:MAG: hypothetical protein A3F14_00375 [Gammaproteobacteria bacterium RIFCSPHIGHO2_12_FULL_43_28]
MSNKDLVLHDLCIHVYQPKLACAYIYYGSKDQPKDHKGVEMGAFYQGEFELKKHLKNEVIPRLNKVLKSDKYKIIDVDLLQGHEPFVTLARKDNNEMKEGDKKAISKLLKDVLEKVNNQQKKSENKLPSKPVLFAPKHGHDEQFKRETEKNDKPRYNG